MFDQRIFILLPGIRVSLLLPPFLFSVFEFFRKQFGVVEEIIELLEPHDAVKTSKLFEEVWLIQQSLPLRFLYQVQF